MKATKKSKSPFFLHVSRIPIGTREGAIEYIEKHRNVAPAIYNMKRLGENPIPNELNVESIDFFSPIEEIIIPADTMNNSMSSETCDNSLNPLAISFDNSTASTFSTCSSNNGCDNNHDGHNLQLFSTANADILGEQNYDGNYTEIEAVADTVVSAPYQASGQNLSSSDVDLVVTHIEENGPSAPSNHDDGSNQGIGQNTLSSGGNSIVTHIEQLDPAASSSDDSEPDQGAGQNALPCGGHLSIPHIEQNSLNVSLSDGRNDDLNDTHSEQRGVNAAPS